LKEYNKLREDAEALKVQADDEEKRGDAEHDRADYLQAKLDSQKVAIKNYSKLREDYESLRSQAEIDSRRADRESSRAANLQAMVNLQQKQVNNLEARLENAKSSGSKMRRELEEAETSIVEANEILDDLIEIIEDRTGYEYNPDLDTREEFIAETVKRLIEDVEALKADEGE
jgi:chromosome segregation ATPase